MFDRLLAFVCFLGAMVAVGNFFARTDLSTVAYVICGLALLVAIIAVAFMRACASMQAMDAEPPQSTTVNQRERIPAAW